MDLNLRGRRGAPERKRKAPEHGFESDSTSSSSFGSSRNSPCPVKAESDLRGAAAETQPNNGSDQQEAATKSDDENDDTVNLADIPPAEADNSGTPHLAASQEAALQDNIESPASSNSLDSSGQQGVGRGRYEHGRLKGHYERGRRRFSDNEGALLQEFFPDSKLGPGGKVNYQSRSFHVKFRPEMQRCAGRAPTGVVKWKKDGDMPIKTIKSQKDRDAVLVHSRGYINASKCTGCTDGEDNEKNNLAFEHCASSPDGLHGACGNCIWKGTPHYCSLGRKKSLTTDYGDIADKSALELTTMVKRLEKQLAHTKKVLEIRTEADSQVGKAVLEFDG